MSQDALRYPKNKKESHLEPVPSFVHISLPGLIARIYISTRIMSHFIDEDSLMEDDTHPNDAGAIVPGGVGSDPRGSSSGFEPSPKLSARIKKLAHWRIDSSSIVFDNDGSESHGGHAIVSKGKMNWAEISQWDLRKRAWDQGWHHEALKYRLWTRQKPGMMDLAVKKMRLADDTDFERVLGSTIREAEFLAKLNHRNIVELEGLVEDVSKGIIWLVLPWAKYGNLKNFNALEKWEIPERISLISDVAQGLEYLHSREPPICHGDLKSLNILVYEDCHARITDFGSARHRPPCDPNMQVEQVKIQALSAQPPNVAFSTSTKTITLTGNKYTLRWAAPELLAEDRLSLRSDIWALGWIAYEVMTEFLPFEDAKSDVVVVKRVLGGELPSLTENDDLRLIDELCSLMNMCWRNNPTERPTATRCRESIKQMPMFPPLIELSGAGQRIDILNHLNKAAYAHQSRGDYERASKFLVIAVERLRKRGGARHLIFGLRDLAQLHRLQNEYHKAFPLLLEALEIYTSCGDRKGRADALWALACLYRLREEAERMLCVLLLMCKGSEASMTRP